MRRGRPPAQPHIPDPSATIPDFGPRPEIDQEKLDEIRKLIPPPEPPAPAAKPAPEPTPQPEAQREPATPAAQPISEAARAQSQPPAPKSNSRMLLIGAAMILFAVLVGALAFFFVTGIGLTMWAYLG